MEGRLYFVFFLQLQRPDASNTRESCAIVDADGVVIGILGAMPSDESWEEVCQSAAAAIEDAWGKLTAPRQHKDHRHGRFLALAVGISHGGGQVVSAALALLPLYLTNEQP